MTEMKITKVDMFAMVKEIVEASDAEMKEAMVEFLDKQVALIESKAAKAKAKAAAKKEVDDEIMVAVKAALTDEFQDLDAIMAAIDMEDVSKAKVTARITKLVKAGLVEKEAAKTEDKKKVMTYKKVEFSTQDAE